MKDYLLTIRTVRPLAGNVYEIVLDADEDLPPMRGGQFLHLEIGGNFLLRRPFCLYAFDRTSITLAVAVVGHGTEWLVSRPAGTKLKAILPIGNGFTLSEAHKKIVLLGGGVGCAPLASVPLTYPDRTYVSYLGFATSSAVMFEEKFRALGETVVATDDGSYGRSGYVTDVLEGDIESIAPDVILTCGPEPMLKAAARLSAKTKIPAYMSGETRMGCGVGACLVCACALKGKDGEVVHKRACVDGPVFSLEEVLL